MAFQVVQERQFKAKITAVTPVDGGHQEERFGATYRVLSTGKTEEYDLGTTEGTNTFLREVIVGLDDLTDANGEPLEYNDQVRDQVIGIPYARRALISGYFDNVSKARKGN